MEADEGRLSYLQLAPALFREPAVATLEETVRSLLDEVLVAHRRDLIAAGEAGRSDPPSAAELEAKEFLRSHVDRFPLGPPLTGDSFASTEGPVRVVLRAGRCAAVEIEPGHGAQRTAKRSSRQPWPPPTGPSPSRRQLPATDWPAFPPLRHALPTGSHCVIGSAGIDDRSTDE